MWKQIFKTTIIAGTLDILAAFVQAYIINKVSPDVVLKYIASGVFGKEAFEGNFNMIFAGLVFHFIIAFACTATFFVLYPKLKFLHHKILLNSLIIALIAWIVTTQIIMPLSKVGRSSFEFVKALRGITILIVCVGLPIAYSAKQFLVNQNINVTS